MIEEKKDYLKILIIAIIVSSGVSLTGLDLDTFKSELDGHYICPASRDSYEFARLSGSEERGYPFQDSNKGYKDCKSSEGVREKWRDLYSYATEFGIDPYDLIQEEEPQATSGTAAGVWGDHYKIKQGQDPVKV